MATTIPTFNNGDSLENVRVLSLNPAIQQINSLTGVALDFEKRLGETPKVISDVNTVEPSGWYFVNAAHSGGHGDGVVLYFTIMDTSSRPISSRQYFYSTTDCSKTLCRQWEGTHWSSWNSMSGQGGFIIDPNPPQLNINYFPNLSELQSKQMRDAYMHAHTAIFDQYKTNIMKLILLEWPDGKGGKTIVYQNWFNGEWIDTFGHFAGILDFSKHTISELKDGSRVSTLETGTANGAVSIGGDAGTNLVETSMADRKIQVSKVKSAGKNLKITKTTDKTVSFEAIPNWQGIYDTVEAAKTGVASAKRFPNKTTVGIGSAENLRLHVWNGTIFSPYSTSGSISAEPTGAASGASIPVNLLKFGNGVKATSTSAGELTLDAEVAGVNVENKSEIKYIHKIKYSTKFGEFSNEGGTDIFTVPSYSLLNSSGGDLGEYKELQAGANISITKDDSIDGRFKINCTAEEMTAQIDGDSSIKRINRIKVANKFAKFEGSESKTLHLPVISAENSDGTNLGQIKNLKAGNYINITMGTGDLDGIASLHVNDMRMQGKAKDGTSFTVLTKLDASGMESVLEDSTLKLFGTRVKDSAGADAGSLKSLKAGSGVTLSEDGAGSGNFTIAATGGGSGGGGISIKGYDTESHNPQTDYIPITQIDVVGDPELVAEAETGQPYTFNLRSYIPKEATSADLTSKWTPSKNKSRLGLVKAAEASSKYKMYYCTGTEWTEILEPDPVAGTLPKFKLDSSTSFDMHALDFSESKDVSTSTFFKIEKSIIDGKEEAKFTIKDPVRVCSDDVTDIDSEFLTGDTPKGTIAYMKPTNGGAGPGIGFVYANGTTGWGRIGYHGKTSTAYEGWSGDHLLRLNKYFPEVVKKDIHPFVADESWKNNGLSYLKKDDSAHPLTGKPNCIVSTITASNQDGSREYAQIFYDVEHGGMYYRYRTPGGTRDSGVEQIAGLSDKHFAIYTPINDLTVGKLRSATSTGFSNKLPLCIIQDPNITTLPVKSKPEQLQVLKYGYYSATLALTLSNSSFTTSGIYYKITWTIKDAVTSTQVATPATHVVQLKKINTVDTYFVMESSLLNIPSFLITEDKTIYNEVKIERCDASGNVTTESATEKTAMDKSEMDPYKCYFVIEPSSSKTKMGARIAQSLRNTLGGVSYEPNVEVRSQKSGSTFSGIRVFGMAYDGSDLGFESPKTYKGA